MNRFLVGRFVPCAFLGLLAVAASSCSGGGGSGDPPVLPQPRLEIFAGAIGGSGNVDGIGLAGAGNLYVSDNGSASIRRITPSGDVSTLAGRPGVAGNADGPAAEATFRFPHLVATDGHGNVYIVERTSPGLAEQGIRRIGADGVVTTVAAPLGEGIQGLAVAADGTLLATGPHRVMALGAGAFTTIAGSSEATGNADGSGVAARFGQFLRIAVDRLGNLFVADSVNRSIRMATPEGIVTTTPAEFPAGYRPSSIALDGQGNLLVVDASRIRRVTPEGLVTTLAGSSETGSADGIGALARFDNPAGIAVGADGIMYVADRDNQLVRRVTPEGQVTTLAGVAGRQGFAPGPLPGVLDLPQSVAIGGSSLYVAMPAAVVVVRNRP